MTNDSEQTAKHPSDLYELCERVCMAIELRPLNYYQGSWCVNAKERARRSAPSREGEACGTAFCRAGWMTAFLLPQQQLTANDAPLIASTATLTLRKAGIPQRDIDALFDGSAVLEEFGSSVYVAQGIRGMQEFMKKWEPQLRAAKLNVEDGVKGITEPEIVG